MFGVIFDLGSLKKQLINLKAQSEVEGFWSDNEKARKVMVEISEIEQNIDLISDFENKIKEVNDYFLLASEENDQAIVSECHETLNKIINDHNGSIKFLNHSKGAKIEIVLPINYEG